MLLGNGFFIDSDYLKNIYFNSDILPEVYFNKAVCFQHNHKEDISYYLPYYNYSYEDLWTSNGSSIYISNEYATIDPKIFIKYDDIKIANVSYHYNYDKEGCKTYFVDDVNVGTLKNIPPVPIRKGYIFEGWFKEKECINRWDFKNNFIPRKQYDEEGNYIYQETILYAKWK